MGEKVPFFTRMRQDAELLLQREISKNEAARMAGVGSRTWSRFENGAQVPSVATLRHFWISANREHVENHDDPTRVSIQDFFIAVDTAVSAWTPRMRR